jgi:predicted nucleic acid-binding protein
LALIFDTGPLVALLDTTDPDHERCLELVESVSELRLVPPSVLLEVEYLLRPWPEAFPALLADFGTGAFQLLELPAEWLARVGELLERYRDVKLGFVDATVLVATEMLGETRLATLDRHHFSAVRPEHVDALTLLP